jgi:Methyltransferase FkbM domain
MVELITILRLDDVCHEFSIGRIAFLKIDVEGFELEVLRGATEALKSRKVQNVIAEAAFSRNPEQHVGFDDLRAMLEPFGYVFDGYYDPTYQPESGQLRFTNALFSLSDE